MAAGIGPSSKQPHVPAWKKLGLKLKYAKEDAVSHSPPTFAVDVTNGNLNEDQSTSERTNKETKTSKKRKHKSEAIEDSGIPDTPRTNVKSSSPSGQRMPLEEQTPAAQPKDQFERYEHDTQPKSQAELRTPGEGLQVSHDPAAPRERRKSVTFASDSKQEDGLGVSRLSKQRHSQENPDSDRPAATFVDPTSKRAQKRQRRAEGTHGSKKSHSANDGAVTGQAETESVAEYVRYLQLFHTSRSEWKFNKNKQKELLKNLFRVERLPAEYNEAILQYISGLQGKRPRQQLIDNAEAVLKSIAEKNNEDDGELDMESSEARRQAYYAALRRQLDRYERAKVDSDEYDDQQVEEMRLDAERGKRAEAVLEATLRKAGFGADIPAGTAPPSEPPVPNVEVNGISHNHQPNGTSSTAQNISKRKRRKARTQASNDDDSDSSSSSSDSEADHNPKKRGPATMHQALRPTSEPKFKPFSQHYSLPKATGTKKIFDDDLLDQMFPKKQSYNDTAPKRKAGDASKARGFAYTHGTRADESASGDE